MRDSELLKIHNTYREQLEQKIKQVRKRLEKNEKHSKPGILKYHKSKSGKYYYSLICTEDNSETYLTKENRHIASAIAQIEYDRKFLAEAETMISLLNSMDRHIVDSGIEAVYSNMRSSKKSLISPVIPDMEKYAEEWEKSEYEKKTVSDDVPKYKTKKDEYVRSKSELIIANALFDKRIPYKYECPVEICGRIIHPDFTILNKNTGNIIYWEHLGMMDDITYRNDALRRISNYESCGIFSGTEIIYTLESYNSHLTPTDVEKKIQKYLS